MPQTVWLLAGTGLGFVILGLVLILIGHSGENKYFTSLTERADVRRYIERRTIAEFISLKVGGRVSIAVGLVLMVTGGVFWLWG
jgi:hypothetical protein